jgi:two-component system, chemotaxis family, chemotaxis protein CheY
MKRVLIAEDDLVGRLVLSRFLEGHAKCDMAVDGQEALHLYSESIGQGLPYELIFLDVMMPKMDGLKVLRAIRGTEAQKQVPGEYRAKVIMITALNDRETVMDSHDLGCVGFVWKPVDLVKMGKLLRDIGFMEPGGEEAR